MSRNAVLLCLVGPAAGGKTTVCRRLLDLYPQSLVRSVSTTTRAPRPGEIEGQSYFFVSREEFERRRSAGELFESEEVHGNWYGQRLDTLSNAVCQGTDLVLDIDIRGAFTVKRNYPAHAVIVFLVPPSFEVLLNRLRSRGPVSDEEVARRVSSAGREYDTFRGSLDCIDYFVVNDDLEVTFQSVNSILIAERLKLTRLDQGEVSRICTVS